MRPTRLIALVLLSFAVLSPAVATASENQLSILQDDDLLIYRDDATRDRTLDKMKALGADAVRLTILWSVIGQNANDTKAQQKRFKKLGADNPKAYPKANWDRYDGLARSCLNKKILCYFDVTGPGPAFAHAKPPKKFKKDAAWWKPKPKAFYAFVRAVGRRYDGTYKDENAPGVLPRITFWSLWNEPNQGGWLRPQYENGKPVSPSLYRGLYLYGHKALESTGHSERTGDFILAGETAPINVARKTTTSAMGPKIFINELLCGPGSTKVGCSDFERKGPLVASAWAHHPYTKKESPLQRNPDPQAITLANFSDLGKELDALALNPGNIQTGLPLISTEFGYETNPPDTFAVTTPADQAQFDQIGDFVTYSDPRVIGNTQFLLRDAKPNKTAKKGSKAYWGTYQSGLFSSGGTPKPSAQAYLLPFLVHPGDAGQVSVWGQLRFLPNTLSPFTPSSVQLEYEAPGAGFVPYGDPLPVTNALGYFSAQVPSPGPGRLRVSWSGPVPPGAAQSLPQTVP